MNKTKELNEQIKQLKQEKIAIKKQKFEEFLVNHFGRELKTGDVVESVSAISDDKRNLYSVVGVEYIEGTFELNCHAIKDGQVLDTFEKVKGTGCNFRNLWTKTQIKYFKFKLVS
jgi:hypothetical protein